jgi:hypothetical protein
MAALRDASELLWPAVAETLSQLDLGSEHAAARKLAQRYAQIIDEASDQRWAARWLMPLLLDTLGELGATPAAKARLTKGGKPADGKPNRLAQLRSARGA